MSHVRQIQVTVPSRVLTPKLLHDLRTPLNHIIGFSELLSERAEDEGQMGYVEDLQKVLTAGKQLLAILNHEAPSEPTAISRPDLKIASDSPPSTGSARILVAEDNEMNRDVLSRRLEQQGHTVVVARNGVETMDILRTQVFDLLLLDIMMPEKDGYQVLREVKDDETLRMMPVIMISALDDVDSIVRCIEMGAEDYLAKPFDPTILKARIDSTLGKKRGHDREAALYAETQEQLRKLRELEKLRDGLTHMIIHDLRTPLSALISGVQTIPVMGEMSESQLEVVEIAIAGGETLLAMINGLLDVDKMESGALDLDYTLLDASQLVASATTQVAQLALVGGLHIVRDIADDVPFFEGDEDILRRVLVNLLGNAIKFTPAGGTITVAVGAQASGEGLQFSVTDTGEGIPAESFERIFERFGQVPSKSGEKVIGTGLGLTFCKMAVEAHGGNISVESGPLGGSRFNFTIPRVAEAKSSGKLQLL